MRALSTSHCLWLSFRPSNQRCGSAPWPHAVRASLYIGGIWIRQPNELEMNKRKGATAARRKRFRRNTTARNPKRKRSSQKQQRKYSEPWCGSCRAHTPYYTSWEYRQSTTINSSGNTTTSFSRVRVTSCSRCDGTSESPYRRQFKACVGGIFFLLLFYVACLYMFSQAEVFGIDNIVEPHDGTLWANCLALVAGYPFYRLVCWFSGYRNYLKWAKEQDLKGNK